MRSYAIVRYSSAILSALEMSGLSVIHIYDNYYYLANAVAGRLLSVTRDRSNSIKGRIVLLNIPTAGMPGHAHLCPPPDCVPWLRTGIR